MALTKVGKEGITGISNASNATAITIDSSENVGIGTTSPGSQLHLSTSTAQNDAHGQLKVVQTDTSGGASTNAGINLMNHYGTSQFMQWEDNGLRIGSRILTNSGVGDVVFTAGADAEKMRILAGGGLTFNGDTAAANALDDYEEGTWTPVDTNGQVSLTVYNAFYTKIGRKVFVEMGILISSNSNSNSVNFSGLPFTAIGGNDNTGGFALIGTSSGRNDLWLVGRATNRIGCSNNLNVDVPFSSYSNKQLKLCGSYTTA